MTKLSYIAAEAQRVVGRLSEAARRALQDSLVALCETHWYELRGMQPVTPLAHALWSVTPPLADLFVDLHATGDDRLADVLAGLKPARGLALLVLAEIERGDMEGIRIAYESMTLFESAAAAGVHAQHVGAALRGMLHRPEVERQFSRRTLLRALAIMTRHTGRDDTNAATTAIRLLTATPAGAGGRPDTALDSLRTELQAIGVRFLASEGDDICYELHGRRRKPISRSRLCDMLAEIRRARLG